MSWLSGFFGDLSSGGKSEASKDGKSVTTTAELADGITVSVTSRPSSSSESGYAIDATVASKDGDSVSVSHTEGSPSYSRD